MWYEVEKSFEFFIREKWRKLFLMGKYEVDVLREKGRVVCQT